MFFIIRMARVLGHLERKEKAKDSSTYFGHE